MSIISLIPTVLRLAPFILKLVGARKASGALKSVLDGLMDGSRTQMESDVEITRILAEAEAEMAEHRANVIMTETRSESWLIRHWRPIVALTSFFSYWFVIILYPFLVAWGMLPQVRFGEAGLENFFWLAVICVTGYMGLRTAEKWRGLR